MNKRLFFVAPSAYPFGGVAVWLDYLILGLKKKGWKVTLALVGGKHHDVTAYRRVNPNIERVIEIANPTGSWEGRVNSLVRAISQNNPDLVVGVNIPDTYEAINRMRHQKFCAPRVAMAIHGIQPDLLDDMAHYKNVLDGVVCTNRLTMHLALEYSEFDKTRLFYAPYGVEPGQVDSGKDTPGRKLKIAWVGRLEQFQKRIGDIPAIIKALVNRGVDFELLIAGDGPDEVALRGVLEREQLTRFVQFLGVIPSKEMQSRVYDACDILLVTSYWETGPIVIWEAMACGVPVVSSKYIGSGLEAGLVDGKNCLLFDFGENESAAAQLQRLQDTELYLLLVAGGYKLIDERYNKKISIQKWDTAFKEVLELPARSAVIPRLIQPAGRLDRVLGTRMGERVRHSLGFSHQHATAGGEWPHSYGNTVMDDKEFWLRAKRLDMR